MRKCGACYNIVEENEDYCLSCFVKLKKPLGPGANSSQVGGSHYQKDIQPWDAIVCWGLGFLDGNVVKYMARWKSKGGLEDLKKARHYLDKLIEQEEKKP